MRTLPACLAVALLVGCGGPRVAPVADAGAISDGPALIADSARPNPDVDFAIPDASATADDAAGPASSCAEESVTATRAPLDLLFLLDRSGSMVGRKWDLARRGMASFVGDPRSAGLGVGLQVFPAVSGSLPTTNQCTTDVDCGFGDANDLFCLPSLGCVDAEGKVLSSDHCSTQLLGLYPPCATGTCAELGRCPGTDSPCAVGKGCAGGQGCGALPRTCSSRSEPDDGKACSSLAYQSVIVPLAALPGVHPAFTSALDLLAPTGGTPMAPAVSGAFAYLRQRPEPTRKAVLVLVTDGAPTSCGPGDPVAEIVADITAARALDLRTYVISAFSPGLDASRGLAAIVQFATAAGTSAIALKPDDTLADQFTAALDGIRGAELPCAYDIPPPRHGAIEYGKVNVRYQSAGAPQDVPYVGKAASCDPARGGWYYDVDPAAGTPRRVLACDATCKVFKSDPSARVDILYGCKTRIIE